MASSSRYVPSSFFMFCRGDFATKLTLPAAFVEEHRLHLHKKVTLQLKTDPAPQSWAVKIKKIDGIFYLRRGWSKFVDDNGIVESKVLTFHLVGDSTLHVSIFGLDSCLELPSPSLLLLPPPSSSTSSEGEGLALERTSDVKKTWRFIKKLKEYNITDQRMDVPKAFALESGMATKQETVLENWCGRKWTVSVTDRNKEMFSFCRGWTEFLVGNKLKVGTYLLFEYVAADNVAKVVVMDKKEGKKLLTKAQYGGFLKSVAGLTIADY